MLVVFLPVLLVELPSKCTRHARLQSLLHYARCAHLVRAFVVHLVRTFIVHFSRAFIVYLVQAFLVHFLRVFVIYSPLPAPPLLTPTLAWTYSSLLKY